MLKVDVLTIIEATLTGRPVNSDAIDPANVADLDIVLNTAHCVLRDLLRRGHRVLFSGGI